MNLTQARWHIRGAAFLVAAALAGCGGDSGGTVPTPAPISDSVSFSGFVNQAFSNSANSTPVSVDVNFTFDVNEEPTAFDSLILSGTY
jgi:hypothetical protein